MPCFSKSLTGALPTQETLPLLLSNTDAYVLPANFRGHLSKSFQEPTLGSCSGWPPCPRAAGEDGGTGEFPTWSGSLAFGRVPSAGKPCRGHASPTANPPCAAASPQHCTLPSIHHVPRSSQHLEGEASETRPREGTIQVSTTAMATCFLTCTRYGEQV